MSLSRKSTALKRAYIIVFGVTLLSIIFVLWASVSSIDEVTRSLGQVIASSRTQVIQSASDGVIATISVKDGEQVKAGQVLVLMEKSQAVAAYSDSMGKVAALKAALTRLSAEVYNKPLAFSEDVKRYPHFVSNQTALYNRRQNALKMEINALDDSLKLVNEELELSKPLLATGDIGKTEIIRLQRQVAEISGQITNRRNKYFQDAQAEMTKTEEELSTQQQVLVERQTVLGRTEVRSPVNGLVKKIHFTTLGAKVRPGDVLLELLPTDGSLIVEGKLKPSDIAYVRTGLPVSIKLDAFDYSVYGVLHGKVSYISPDAITEESRQGEVLYYRVQVSIDEHELPKQKPGKTRKIEIQPGMTAVIEIKTGKKTVLHYLSKPIIKTFSESLGER